MDKRIKYSFNQRLSTVRSITAGRESCLSAARKIGSKENTVQRWLTLKLCPTFGVHFVTGIKRKERDFGYYLDLTENNYNGIKDNAELVTGRLGAIKRGYIVKNLYEFNKAYKYYNGTDLLKPGAAATKVVNGIKGAGKIVKRLGPVGNLLTAGNITYEIKTDSWDAHTVIDGALLVGTAVVATVAAAPVVAAVAIGTAIYGVLDYFFDIGDKVDAAVGRKSGIW